MNKSRIKLLVVDDELGLAAGIQEALQRGRAREADEVFYQAFKAVQFAMDDVEACGKPGLRFGKRARDIFFEQLYMNVERTERIADFMRQPGDQSRQQFTLFLRGTRNGFLPQGAGKYRFHDRTMPKFGR